MSSSHQLVPLSRSSLSRAGNALQNAYISLAIPVSISLSNLYSYFPLYFTSEFLSIHLPFVEEISYLLFRVYFICILSYQNLLCFLSFHFVALPYFSCVLDKSSSNYFLYFLVLLFISAFFMNFALLLSSSYLYLLDFLVVALRLF